MRLTCLIFIFEYMFQVLLSFHLGRDTQLVLVTCVSLFFILCTWTLTVTSGWPINYSLAPQRSLNSARSQKARKDKQNTMLWTYDSTLEMAPAQVTSCFNQQRPLLGHNPRDSLSFLTLKKERALFFFYKMDIIIKTNYLIISFAI